MLFRQLFDSKSSTYTYLLADEQSLEAVLIDPVLEQAERDEKLICELNLNLCYLLETHIHADHITAAAVLRERLGGVTVVSKHAPVTCADRQVGEGETILFGSHQLSVLETPGHTHTCLSYICSAGSKKWVFTGDTLLVRGCGRTDFQSGSAKNLFHSVRTKLFSLPDDTAVFPAHDYQGMTQSSIGEEKRFNSRLNLNIGEAEFIEIMENLNLPNPKYMAASVPANLECGQIGLGPGPE